MKFQCLTLESFNSIQSDRYQIDPMDTIPSHNNPNHSNIANNDITVTTAQMAQIAQTAQQLCNQRTRPQFLQLFEHFYCHERKWILSTMSAQIDCLDLMHDNTTCTCLSCFCFLCLSFVVCWLLVVWWVAIALSSIACRFCIVGCFVWVLFHCVLLIA